jgi:hypothetical protein
MKTKLGVIISTFFFWTGLWAGYGMAGPVGDIDADGQITVIEAVGALQVSTGTRVPAYTNETIYRPSEYQSSQALPYRKIWQQTEFNSGKRSTVIGIDRHFQDTLNGQDVLAVEAEAGIFADYNLIEYYKDDTYLGWRWATYYELFDPPVVNKITDWSTGHQITNMTVLKTSVPGRPVEESFHYREYTLLGVEDVTVPAGRFTDCLKILSRRASDGRAVISYRAKGVGSVKVQRANERGGGYLLELLDIEKSDGTSVYGNLSGLCMATGTWTAQSECNSYTPYNPYCIESAKFTLVYDTSKALPTYLNMAGFEGAWGLRSPGGLGIQMTTTDGITFTPDPSANWPDNNHDGQPDLPDITLTIDGTTVTGSLVHYNITFVLSGTVTCP